MTAIYDLNSDFYESKTINSWNRLAHYYKKNRPKFDGWLFRGQTNAEWSLEPSLERAAITRFKACWGEVPEIERGLVRLFRRQLHIYFEEALFQPSTLMECLALMQHYGAPTRLLDWTYSFFVAVYFAFESVKPGATCAVWGFDRDWWRGRARSRLPNDVKTLLKDDPNTKKEQTIREILLHNPPLMTVHPLSPLKLSRRQVLQQGAFLVQGDVCCPFMKNLEKISDSSERSHLIKLELPCTEKLLKDAVTNLHKMNINRATLFPGLDGFAKHMETIIAMPRLRADDPDAMSFS